MKFRFIDDKVAVLRLEKGDEIIESIMKCCERLNIKTGMISGIGAAEGFELAVYRKKKKGYKKKKLKGEHEILSIAGNVTTMNSKPYIHIHVSLADGEMKCFGGHLEKATITATGEIFIFTTGGIIDRKYSKDININLMNI